MELVSIKDLPQYLRARLLRELGYEVSGDYIYQNNQKVLDKYIGVEVKVSNMLIFPGSTVILDNNPLSVAAYLDEYKKEL
ncbi:MAG: hypothetical protein M1530_01270 [Candidatus Marsarchaeota archaeon]|nr:hypothetical protein [Candidatus Marsarchaeota archaeon]